VTDPADDVVLYEVSGDGVATITWNRPDRKNAWSYPMEARYFELLDRADSDPAVRAIVVTGAGSAFCPGMDVAQLDSIVDVGVVKFEGRRPQTYALRVKKPMVAAINGACAGIGLIQALVCDVRFVQRGARLTTAFARRGLMAEHGIAWLLPQTVGRAVAADLLLSARVIDADDALGLGLVSRVVDEDEGVLAAAQAYATDLARNCSPTSMAVIKHQLALATGQDQEEARLMALPLVQHYTPHPDFKEGMASFAERRAPTFAPLPEGFTPGDPF